MRGNYYLCPLVISGTSGMANNSSPELKKRDHGTFPIVKPITDVRNIINYCEMTSRSKRINPGTKHKIYYFYDARYFYRTWTLDLSHFPALYSDAYAVN